MDLPSIFCLLHPLRSQSGHMGKYKEDPVSILFILTEDPEKVFSGFIILA
jgi:hypothetical protein